MQTSRKFVASILKAEGKEDTQTCKALTDNSKGKLMLSENSGNIEWSEFSNKELTSISKMKLKSSNLSIWAKNARLRRNHEKGTEKKQDISKGNISFGPEPI